MMMVDDDVEVDSLTQLTRMSTIYYSSHPPLYMLVT
jgi:hypothetical protein